MGRGASSSSFLPGAHNATEVQPPLRSFLISLLLKRSSTHGSLRTLLNGWLRESLDDVARLKAVETKDIGSRKGSSIGLAISDGVQSSMESLKASADRLSAAIEQMNIRSSSSASGTDVLAQPGKGHSDEGGSHSLIVPATVSTMDAFDECPTGRHTSSEFASTPATEHKAAAWIQTHVDTGVSTPRLLARSQSRATISSLGIPTPQLTRSSLSSCGECQSSIDGPVFMLNDRAYCCQRHRLAAYHKHERETQQRGALAETNDAGVHALCSGLIASYRTWS